MGWAERNNPKSKWNKNRNSEVLKAETPRIKPVTGEPVVIQLSFRLLWEKICRRLKRTQAPSPALTS